jgi:hypothetical protein
VDSVTGTRHNQDGELVKEMYTIRAARSGDDAEQGLAVPHREFDLVAVGDRLPPTAIPLTCLLRPAVASARLA